jgi:hypothetical protein
LPNFGVASIGETSFPSPPRALPPCRRSYGLMCHSLWALSSFGIEPRPKSPCRSYSAPAAHGSFPTLSLKIFPWMLDPVPRRSHRVRLPVSSPVSSAFPQRRWGRLPASIRESRLLAGPCFRGLQIFLNVPASKFAHPPDRPYRCAYCHRAAGAFTSGHIVLRYLRTHRIC